MKSLAQAKLKRTRALELVAEGQSYDQVGAVDYRHRGSAHKAVFKALAEREADGVEHLRNIEVARLDHLQVALWDDAMAGKPHAVNSILRIIEQRSRLLGLHVAGTATGGYGGLTHLVVGAPEGNLGEETGDHHQPLRFIRRDLGL